MSVYWQCMLDAQDSPLASLPQGRWEKPLGERYTQAHSYAPLVRPVLTKCAAGLASSALASSAFFVRVRVQGLDC